MGILDIFLGDFAEFTKNPSLKIKRKRIVISSIILFITIFFDFIFLLKDVELFKNFLYINFFILLLMYIYCPYNKIYDRIFLIIVICFSPVIFYLYYFYAFRLDIINTGLGLIWGEKIATIFILSFSILIIPIGKYLAKYVKNEHYKFILSHPSILYIYYVLSMVVILIIYQFFI